MTPPAAVLRSPIAALLATIVVACGSAEMAVRSVALPASQIEARTTRELRHAIRLRHDSARVLVVGNSLLLAAVDVERVQAGLSPSTSFSRLVVEQTAYWDWWYGLSRLWSEGSRPSVVVLMLDARQLVSDISRGDYSAFRLVASNDVISFGRAIGMHPTEISRLTLSRLSAFYGFRGELRKVLLGRLIPGLSEAMLAIVPKGAFSIDEGEALRIARQRFRDLRAEADKYGARVIFALAPVPTPALPDSIVARAAAEAGLAVIQVKDMSRYTQADFTDGYHLSASGAQKYTSEFQQQIQRLVVP